MDVIRQAINNFGIAFCTINGSGSATANNIILRAIYNMGIPVSGRNIFPSNIQGMPTKYTMRVNGKGYLGRVDHNDILVCLNEDVLEKELDELTSGGVLILDRNYNIPKIKPDCSIIRVPISQILAECDAPAHLNVYLANMVYVGVLAKLIDIDMDKIISALNKHFQSQKKAVVPNENIILHAFKWAENHLNHENKFTLQKQKFSENKILVNGNKAGALGSLYGGLQFVAWYPITPATGITQSVNEYIPKLRFDEDSLTTTCVVVQAEDELASIGMVVGAGWAGLRSMTATSGPGLCLMAEFFGLAYFSETPIVVWDVQRVGPSTGLPTRTSQGDLAFAYSMSHGDTNFIILLPGNVKECFEFGWKAFDIADEFQMPVLILSDLELGMNDWVSEEFVYPDSEMNRGKIIWEDGLEELISKDIKWGRYLDIDGDGIPYRTIPGNLHPKASYFARGTGHDEYAHYTEDAGKWKKNLNRLKKKYISAKDRVPGPILYKTANNSIGIISYGSNDMAVKEVVDSFLEKGDEIDYLRIRAIPFNEELRDFLKTHNHVFVVENNRDGQMKNILVMNFPIYAEKLISIAHIDGLSISAKWIEDHIKRFIKG